MLSHEGSVGMAPAMTAVAVIAAVSGSLWWESREEPQPAAPAPVLQPVVSEARPVPQAPADVIAFARFANAQAPERLPLDHGHTSRGLRQLAAALEAAGGSILWRDRARRLEEAAAELERDPHALDHADIASEAFVQAAEWIADLRGRADDVLEAARDIDVEAPLGSQAGVVSRFFRAAAASLRSAPGDAAGERRA